MTDRDSKALRAALAEIVRALRNGVQSSDLRHLPPRLAEPLAECITLANLGQHLGVTSGLRLGVALACPETIPLPPAPEGPLDDMGEDDDGPKAA